MRFVKTVAPSHLQNLSHRLSRPTALFSSKSLRSFNTVSSDTKLNLNLEFLCSIFELKVNQISGGSKLASKLSATVQKKTLKMLELFRHQSC